LRFLALGAAVALGAASASAAVNLVSDGNFSEGASANSFATYDTNSPVGAGSPWTVGPNVSTGALSSVDLIGTYWAAPPSGGYSVDLDGNSVSSIFESVTVPTAGEYLLSFYISGNQDGGPATKSYSVTIGGNTFDLTTSNSAQADEWTLVNETVALGAGANFLQFASLDTSDSNPFGPVVGGVSLVSVPEPSTWTMMALGFAGLGFAGFRGGRRRAIAITA
jgi:hypothetical protein